MGRRIIDFDHVQGEGAKVNLVDTFLILQTESTFSVNLLTHSLQNEKCVNTVGVVSRGCRLNGYFLFMRRPLLYEKCEEIKG